MTLGIILGKPADGDGMTILRIKDGGIAAQHGGLRVGMRCAACALRHAAGGAWGAEGGRSGTENALWARERASASESERAAAS